MASLKLIILSEYVPENALKKLFFGCLRVIPCGLYLIITHAITHYFIVTHWGGCNYSNDKHWQIHVLSYIHLNSIHKSAAVSHK